MFEHLTKWSRILVTGPQRSGTRICAKMIADDTGFGFVDENRFHVDSVNHLWHILNNADKIVVQAPTMTAYANLFGMADEHLAVVLMRRQMPDIMASRRRIGWNWEFPELLRYHTIEGNSAEIKYRNWDMFQRQDLGDQAYEVAYDALASHRLWIPKEERENFAPNQTEVRK